MPRAEHPRRGSPRALVKVLHANTGCLSTSLALSCPPCPAAALQSSSLLPPAVGDTASAAVSPAGLSSEHPGTAAGSGRTPPLSVGSLFRTRYSPPSGNPFDLLNFSCLLPSDGQDVWSVSSVKGFLKYKVLMKSCLVGEQYHLTRLLKKSCLKYRSTNSGSFRDLGGASALLWHTRRAV